MLHYKKIGNGFPIMLIHGFPNSHKSWLTIAEELKADFTLLLPDLPGAGDSAPFPEKDVSLKFAATQLNEILVKEDIEKIILIGHSMGGYTAMECAKLFPEKIVGLSMVHSLASADDEEKKINRQKSIKLIMSSDIGKKEFLKAMAANLFPEEYAAQHQEDVQKVIENGDELSQTALANFYTAIMNRNDNTDVLSKINFPIQWIIGSEDKATPKDLALEQSAQSTISDVRIMENVGHMSFMEKPLELIKSLSEFCHFCIDRKPND